MKIKLDVGQVWYNSEVDELFIVLGSYCGFIMRNPSAGGGFINQDFVNNPKNGWEFIGEL